MHFSSLLIAAAAATLASAAEVSDVLQLTATSFDTSVNPEPLMLVEFFAPWCGHCKALAPHYEEAATALKEKNIKIAKVDCTEESDLCQSHGIQGYPTLKVFRNGTPSEYTGPRKADGIISYMVKQSLPAVSPVTAANHEEFKTADKIVVVAYLASSTADPAPEFSSVAETHRDDYLFGLVTDAEVAGDNKVPSIVVYRSFDEPKSVYPYPVLDATAPELATWIKELAIPVMDEVNGDNYGTYAQSDKPLAYLFIDPTSADKDATIAAIKPVAAKYKSKMNFVWINAEQFGDHAKALNLLEAKWPAFVVQDMVNQLKYPLSQADPTTAEKVEEWVAQYIGGKLEPELKSAAIPETQDEPVFVLVGKQFDEVIFDDNKDVFVEFYASWCGHCKRLKPIWDQLGERYQPIKDRITIAKMEAQENDLPPSAPFRVSGFPTIKFKPAGSREFIDYEGDRSLESLIAFVEENAKNSLELPPVAEKPVDAEVPEPEVFEEHDHEHDHDEHDEL